MSQPSFTLSEIAKLVGGGVRGDASRRITGVSGIATANESQITWLSHEKYEKALETSKAGAVVVPENFGETRMPAILVRDPAAAMVTVLQRFAPPIPRPPRGIHPTAVIAPSAQISTDAAIGPYVVIGERAVIGERNVLHANVLVSDDTRLGTDCELWPGVVIRERCTLGNRVVIHPNSTVGSDGFGYQFIGGQHVKIPQIGEVEIEDDVEIGANCTIDRSKFGVTRIGRGTKIDNLVQIAHNVEIGPLCIIVAQTGIGGSTRLGAGVILGGQSGLRDHLTIGDGAEVMACAGVSKDVPAGAKLVGRPAVDAVEFTRQYAVLRRLPELSQQIKELVKRVEQLEAAADDRKPG